VHSCYNSHRVYDSLSLENGKIYCRNSKSMITACCAMYIRDTSPHNKPLLTAGSYAYAWHQQHNDTPTVACARRNMIGVSAVAAQSLHSLSLRVCSLFIYALCTMRLRPVFCSACASDSPTQSKATPRQQQQPNHVYT
jgi:hypothetical protein